MANSLAHTKIERPTIEVSGVPRLSGAEIAASEAIYISQAEQAAALSRLVRRKEPLFCAGTKKYAALTFDDGPSATTPQLVKALENAGVPATWFDVGQNAQAMPVDTKLQGAYGPIGNHTWSHANLTTLSTKDIKTELNDTQDVIRAQTGQNHKMMRPPYGARDTQTQRVIRKMKFAEILWSADSQDGLAKPAATIAQNSIDGLGPGSVILLHDGPAATLAALKKIFAAVKRSGLTMVTVPELLVLNPPSDEQLDMGPRGCSHAGRVNVSGTFVANPELAR